MDIEKLKYIVGKAETDRPAVIRFFDSVNAMSAQNFNSEFLWLQDVIKPSKIIVLINSEGGSVVHGISMFSVIQSCPVEVECVVEGIAASMATIMWAAGTRAYMHDYSLVMIHNPFSKSDDTEDENTKIMINAFRQQMEIIYRKRFGLSKERVQQIMQGEEGVDGTFLTAPEVVAAGIIPQSHVIKTSKQVCERVKNAIAGVTEAGAIKDAMNFINAEMDENKLIGSITTIHKQNEQELQELQKLQAKKLMEEKDKFSFGTIAAQLGFAESAPVTGVTNRIADLLQKETELEKVRGDLGTLQIQYKGKETEVANIQTTLDSINAELKIYKEAEQAAKDQEIVTMVKAAIREGKIEKESEQSWIDLAKGNFDLTKNTLGSIPARVTISAQIANDPNNLENAQNALTEVERKIKEQVSNVVGENFELQTF
jgi:ATP-dependent protease ClpP protease subunit